MASLAALLLVPSSSVAGSDDPALTYEADIRPILRTHCFHCHGESDTREGDLDVRLRRLIADGGHSGPAIVAGKPSESLLYERIRAGEMPPEDVEHRPSEQELETIRRWISDGAKTARPEPEDLDLDRYVTEEERSFWSFQPIGRPAPPQVEGDSRVRTPIDRFVLSRLEQEQLSFSEDADRLTLLRRVYFDLLGMPPTPEATARFLADDSPGAYERLVDRLLSSPRYGERWGRHWLDVAGYADSEGYTDSDPVRPDAYKYRDYVIRSFNADKAFDRFIVQQLAGDELIERRPLKNLSPEEIENLVATGFLRMAPDGTASGDVDQAEARNDVLAKTIEIVSTSLLGLTVGCAQCHDHRYDPIPQVDYYALRGIFEPALDWKDWKTPPQRRLSLYTDADREKAKEIEQQAKEIEAERAKKQKEFIEATFERELAKLDEELREPVREARDTAEDERTPEQKQLLKEYPSVNVTAGSLYLYDREAADKLKELKKQAKELRETKPAEEFVRALYEPPGKEPPETYLFYRGDHEQPKEELAPRELTVLTSHSSPDIPRNHSQRPTSGRRLAYARWLTSGEHPLTARVLVNRVWLHHFGQGLVPTPGDFGALGIPPTHPELLDWLASQFMENDWSLKQLHRQIMTSTVYRQASRIRPECEAVDAENRWYWRMPVRRLEAEALRDSILTVSGRLNRKAFGPAVPVMPDRVGQYVIGIENLNAGRPGEVIPMHGEQYRRSVYVQARRSRPLSVMEPFDIPAMDPNCTARKASTVATQSLLMMNSQFATDRASDLADRIRQEAGKDLTAQIRRAWQVVFTAEPTQQEVVEAKEFVQQQAAHFKAHAPKEKEDKEDDEQPHDPRLEALASLCHAMLSSNRFLYVD